MNGMQFSSNIITVLAWPLVVILLLVVYRRLIVSSIITAAKGRQIKKFKVGPIEFEWFSEISSVGQDVGKALKDMPPGSPEGESTSTSLVDLIYDINNNPRSGIRKAFRLVRKTLDESYPELASESQDHLSDAMKELVRRNLLHEDVENAINQLQKLLTISNSDADMVDPARGYQFLLLAEGAIHGILRSAQIHADELNEYRLSMGLTPIRPVWQGWYNRDFIIELRIGKWIDGTEFVGEMSYPGSGTVTSVTGNINKESAGGSAAVMWRERGYVNRGNRSIDLHGDYRATISDNIMVGKWYKGEQPIGEFELLGK